MKNPFEQTQYSNFIQTPGDINLKGMGASGIQDIFDFLKKQIILRQESIRSAYIDGFQLENIPPFVDVTSLLADSPSSAFNAQITIVDAVGQFFIEHNSGLFIKLCLYRCSDSTQDLYFSKSSEPLASGFFNKVSILPSGTVVPLDEGYFTYFDDLLSSGITNDCLENFKNPRRFDSSFPSTLEYFQYLGYWANCCIGILNNLVYIHRKIIYGFTNVACQNNPDGCSFDFYDEINFDGENLKKPVEVILDVRDGVVCNNNSYGYFCFEFEAVNPCRMVVLSTFDRASESSTNILRSALYGFTQPDPSSPLNSNFRSYCHPTFAVGYCNSQYYDFSIPAGLPHPKFINYGPVCNPTFRSDFLLNFIEEEPPNLENGISRTGQVLAKFKSYDGLISLAQHNNIKNLGMSKVQEGKIKDYSYQTDYYLLDPPESKSPDRYIAELKFTGAFEWVVEDVLADPVAFCTNDPLLNSQYHHDIMESCEAWEIHPGSPSIHVAICDTGIDIGHEDLEPNRLPAYNAVLSTRGAE
jgi:hypothetical protein